MKPTIVKNFITVEECELLNQWTKDNRHTGIYQAANMGLENTQYTTRYCTEPIPWPEIAYTIKQRIRTLLDCDTSVDAPFSDGIVNFVYTSGADIREHKDPVWTPLTYTLHCNIMTQSAASGGDTFIEGQRFSLEQGDLLYYPVSELVHSVDTIQGERCLWTWAFCVPRWGSTWDDRDQRTGSFEGWALGEKIIWRYNY